MPFAPGGNIDIVGRSVAVPLGKILGQSVIVDNRAGGSGSIGTGVVARAAPDGYTLLVATAGQIVTLPQMFKTAYRSDSLKPLGLVSKTHIATIVRKGDQRFKTFQELVAYAKANPGKLNGGHAGAGTPNHLALLQLESALGIQLTMVAYKGMGPALIDLLSGQIDVVGDQVSSSMPHLKAGTLEALAVLGPEREAAFPAVPTLAELKLGNFDMTTYAGILAPGGVPAEIRSRLSDAVRQAAADPAFSATLRELGSAAHGGTAAQFSGLLKDEEAFAARMIQQGRLKAD
ncbi:tripartite tricarboxylate transporter substrate binding protein [Acidovorax sp. NCPPB 4044]|nr:tripartite tricarboxylate transporter substrate binding protein [Acidovorax sp. NCPPB 4044]MDA8520161.1 tripartite tricarboxylate transporter substrate binding protein [Acidovorax sp. NCPPB 4044]